MHKNTRLSEELGPGQAIMYINMFLSVYPTQLNTP